MTGGAERIRVAYVVNRYVTGGQKTLLLSYSQRLDSSRFRVDYLASDFEGDVADEVERYGGRAFRLPKVSRPLAYVRHARRLMARERYDIVQASMTSLNPIALVPARMAGVPVRISYSLSSSHPSERTTRVKDVLRRFGSFCATDLAANARRSGEWLFGGGSDFHVIPNPVDLGTYRFSQRLRDEVRGALGLGGCYVLGHIGRFEHQKNHDFLIRLFRAVADADDSARLVLVGWGGHEGRTMALVDELGLSDRVLNLGKTEDIAGLYNAFDCFVLPSYYEGSPVVGLEAQATGCPCVFSSEVTAEARVNEAVSFVGLDAPLSEWVETVLGYRGASRSVSDSIRKYEADSLAKELEAYYESSLRRARRGGSR